MREVQLTAPPAESKLDVRAILGALRSRCTSEAFFERWLPQAYADPAAFERALYEHLATRRAGLKTRAGEPVDFYYDCVVAHLGRGRPALIGLDRGVVRSLTFEALHEACSALLVAWRRAGVTAGQTLYLGLELGRDYLVALMTALRAGLIVCPVPPYGPSFVRYRLQQLRTDWAILPGRMAELLIALRSGDEALTTESLPLSADRGFTSPDTYSYAPDESALRCLAIHGEEAFLPCDISARRVHAALVRDSSIVLALDQDDVLAAPALDALVHQPMLVLSAMLAGAAFVALPLEDVLHAPERLGEVGVTVLGVGTSLRRVIEARGAWPFSTVRAWFRCLTSELDWTSWDNLSRWSAKLGIPSFNVAFANTAPGGLLFGPARAEPLNFSAWPVPGPPFVLTEVLGGSLEALADTGVYSPMNGDEPVPGIPRLTLTRQANNYLSSGALELGPEAQRYPIEEASRVLQHVPGVRYASVVVSAGRPINSAQITWLLFTDVQPDDPTRPVIADVRRFFEREMGTPFLPQRIEMFSLRPRTLPPKTGTETGSVIHGWCRSQYLSGSLTAKERSEVFRLLSRLSYLFDSELSED
ncbi:MAG TPA: hypothetical protein VFQ61_02155 [Polyangiaceae bacterium]|nr:hypothetical protein [Polyangiaceae bacterium]